MQTSLQWVLHQEWLIRIMDIDIDSLKELCSQEILDNLITISRKESDPNIHFANMMTISR